MAQWQDRLRQQGCPENLLSDPDKALSWLQAKADEAEAKLKAEQSQPVRFHLSEKTGAVMALGLGRFPTTLYSSQWERLISGIPVLQTFLKDNAARIKTAEAAGKAAKTAANGTNG